MKSTFNQFRFIFIFLLITIIVSSCGKEKSPLKFSAGENGEVTPIKLDPTKTDPAWAKLKKNIFDESCTKCHNPDTAKRKKRLDLTQKEIVLENYDDIVYRMTEAFDQGFDYMPPKGTKVSAGLIKELQDWKAQLKL